MPDKQLEPRANSLNRVGLLAVALVATIAVMNVAASSLPAPWQAVTAIGSVALVLAFGLVGFGRLSRRLGVERGMARSAEENLRQLAHRDNLTGLANRAQFNLDIARAMADGNVSRFALVIFDLNHFKAINDAFGHAAGDAVLVNAAARARQVMGQGDRVARVGGDEFAIIHHTGGDGRDLTTVLAQLVNALSLPVRHDGMEIAVGASIGVAVWPDHADTPARLQTLADRALYRAKSLGGGVCQFDRLMLEASLAEDEMANDIPGAFRNREFQFHYQTKVRLSDGSHVGFEALARWHHPRLGIVYPATFIPLLERMGLMVELTRHLLEQVAGDIASWRAAGLSPGPVAVNLPEAVLGTNLALREIEQVLSRHDLPWSALTVELTEDVFIDRALTQIQANVRELNRRGVHVSLDDFGTGYASLTHLRNFPFDEIKIDRSFIAEIGKDANTERIISAMIGLGRDLGKVVVAEGIETPAQRGWLREHGCSLGQGFLFGRPEPTVEAAMRLTPVSGLINVARQMQASAANTQDDLRTG